jgi:ribosomal protein L11 methyltransferase
VAVDATRANAALNGMAARIEVVHSTLPEAAPQPFELVLANLVAAVIVELAPRLAAHTQPGGTLLAGGIVVERCAEVLAALEASGFRSVTQRSDGEWTSLRLVRAE